MKAQKVALIYPGMQTSFKSGKYFIEGTSEISESECSIISINVEKEFHRWQRGLRSGDRKYVRDFQSFSIFYYYCYRLLLQINLNNIL